MESIIAPSIIVIIDANMENVLNDIVVLEKRCEKGVFNPRGKHICNLWLSGHVLLCTASTAAVQ
jgi:hypothetical protein